MKKTFCFGICFLILTVACSLAANVEHAIAVTIEKADLGRRTVLVKTINGAEQIFRFTPQTPITSLAEAAISRSLHGGAGYQFVIRYQIKLGEKVATAFDYVGREEWKEFSGSLLKVDPSLRTILVRTNDGREETLVAGKFCTVESSAGAKKFLQWATGKTAAEDPVIVRYTLVKGQKVAHLLELVQPPS